ncbi:MAG: hypothetical protein JSS86_20080 [Cyanobacteria bacterium SZAS LIN-2]|nr:hypothetical protein [Cyanobacteria bacterium SZAS LIN-2]
MANQFPVSTNAPMDAGAEPLVDMASCIELNEVFAARTKNRGVDVFAQDGSIVFTDLFNTDRTPAPMTFKAQDRFSAEPALPSQQDDPALKEADLKKMSVQELQELHRRISQVHAALSRANPDSAKTTEIERG